MSWNIKDYSISRLFEGDKGIWMIYFLLCIISLVEIYSASSNLTFKRGNHWDPVVDQAIFLFMGFLIIQTLVRIPCKFFKLIPIIGVPVVFALLLYLVVHPQDINSASRWIPLFGYQFQPSELAKPMLILQVAVILSKANVKRRKISAQFPEERKKVMTQAFRRICLYMLIFCGMIVSENFSTAFLLGLVLYVMMFVGNIPKVRLGQLALVIAAVAVAATLALVLLPDRTLGKGRPLTWKNRITAHLAGKEAEDAKNKSTYDINEKWQEDNSRIAIANSNVIGLGVGNSIERDFLPHAESDFIYSIIIEETGLLGGLIVMMLYVTLLVRVWKVAQRCDCYFPAYLIIGLGLMMVIQALVNMAVAVGLFPVTGQTLPLISRGGTSIVMTSFSIGLILSVSRYVEHLKDGSGNEVKENDSAAHGARALSQQS